MGLCGRARCVAVPFNTTASWRPTVATVTDRWATALTERGRGCARVRFLSAGCSFLDKIWSEFEQPRTKNGPRREVSSPVGVCFWARLLKSGLSGAIEQPRRR